MESSHQIAVCYLGKGRLGNNASHSHSGGGLFTPKHWVLDCDGEAFQFFPYHHSATGVSSLILFGKEPFAYTVGFMFHQSLSMVNSS